MTKRFPLYIIIGLLTMCMSTACNDDDNDSVYYVDNSDYDNCGITSFSLGKNDSILYCLDSVYFAVDLVEARVYNADSLPKGTDISHFTVNVSATAASKVEFSFKSAYSGSDTIVNITENPSDEINFANGSVTMTVTSYNGQKTRNYTVDVLVHNEVGDTLYWDTLQRTSLPQSATSQKTVSFGDKLYTLMGQADGSVYMASITAPDDYTSWTTVATGTPANVNVTTFSATDDAMYVTDKDGKLYSTTDGQTWTSTGAVMNCVYGGYGTILLGARKDADGWKHVTWPASSESNVAPDCPISGTSQLIIYRTKWSNHDMAMMVGGKDASDRYTGETWAYDGTRWERISTTGIDEREGVTLFPYSTPVLTEKYWKETDQSALLAMGGRYETEDGMKADNTVYVSYDFGITWKTADSYLQFPESYPGFSNAQAFVKEYTLHSRSASSTIGWEDITVKGMPVWGHAIDSRSRVTKPITSWECPYIFIFGGEDTDGNLLPYVTKGVIKRFTFQPLY